MDDRKVFCGTGVAGDAPGELPSEERHADPAVRHISGRPRPWHRPFGDDDVDGPWGGEAWYPDSSGRGRSRVARTVELPHADDHTHRDDADWDDAA
jgi:hypothetical protein